MGAARFSAHFTVARNTPTTKFHKALNKYPLQEQWDLSILEDNLTFDQANEREMFFIQEYDSFKKGYNSTIGGDGSRGRKNSKQTRLKMSSSAVVRANTEIGKIQMAKAGSAGKGRTFSESHKTAIANALTGHAVSDAARAKLRAANLGKKTSEETKLKLCKSWTLIDPLGQTVVIPNLVKFCSENNLRPERMRDLANGKAKASYKGWSKPS